MATIRDTSIAPSYRTAEMTILPPPPAYMMIDDSPPTYTYEADLEAQHNDAATIPSPPPALLRRAKGNSTILVLATCQASLRRVDRCISAIRRKMMSSQCLPIWILLGMALMGAFVVGIAFACRKHGAGVGMTSIGGSP